MQPRNSLNLRQRPLRPQKDERPITMKNINLKENGSLSDLSSIQVNDDLNLLSPDMYEEKSTRSKNLKKYFEEYSKSNKSKGRESLMSKFEKNINPFQNINYQKCLLHAKVADLICLKDKTVVCCNCALFGEHKGHDVINLQGLLSKLASFTEQCLERYEGLKELQSTFNENALMQRCTEKLLVQKQKEEKRITDNFDELKSLIKQAEKKALLKLQTTYKNKLSKFSEFPELEDTRANVQKWYQEVQKLAQFIEDTEDLQSKTNSIKYIDGSGFGDKLINNGQNLMEQLKSLEEEYEKRLQVEEGKDVCYFNEEIKKEIQNYFTIKNFEKAKSEKQKSYIQEIYTSNIQVIPEFSVKAESQEDYLLASVVQQPSGTEDYGNGQIKLQNIPMLSISQIKFNTHTMSSNQSSDCSRYILKEHQEKVVPQQQKRRKKIEVGEKFKGVVDDLKYDRAQIIDLTGAELGDLNTIALSEYIKKSKKLRVLKLIKNKLTDDCLTELLMGMQESKITSLNLSQNTLSDKSLNLFEKISCPSLKNVTLSLNKINRRNVKIKIQALSNKGISVLL